MNKRVSLLEVVERTRIPFPSDCCSMYGYSSVSRASLKASFISEHSLLQATLVYSAIYNCIETAVVYRLLLSILKSVYCPVDQEILFKYLSISCCS